MNVGNILLENQILLESGTNELEILVFRLGEYSFGMNVAKVREVLPLPTVTSVPESHASVLGVFRLRNSVVPCVSLRKHLGCEPAPANVPQNVILADFNCQQTAFVVDDVERIHRMHWDKIFPLPPLQALSHTPVTALAKIDQRLIILLDVEMIADQINHRLLQERTIPNPHGIDRGHVRLLLADDSPTVRQALQATLSASGYTNFHIFQNGKECWEWIEKRFQETGDPAAVCDVIVSDVEMPQIDGLHLTKRMKEHAQLRSIPVMLYSSIVTPDNYKKGQAVGADVQVAKPDLERVVEIIDAMVIKSRTSEAVPAKIAPANSTNPGPVVATSPTPVSAASTSKPIAPANSNTNYSDPLWHTFRVELGDRVRALHRFVDQLNSAPNDINLATEILRALHTIKSAAMVVRATEITNATHSMETHLQSNAGNPSLWPLAEIGSYIEWLQDVADPQANVAAVLAGGANK